MTDSKLRTVPFRERIANAKGAYALNSVFRDRDGIEVSIPNIIVAVSVSIAIIAAVIIGVVWVVPWAEDNNAQSALSTIQNAEQLYFAQNNIYGTPEQLVSSGSNQVLLKGNTAFNITASKLGYCAVVADTSTGNDFYADSASAVISSSAPTDSPVTCPDPKTAATSGW